MDNTAPVKLGPIKMAPGFTRGHGFALLASGLFTAILAPYINFAQPYILTEHLQIPEAEQGTVSGDLAFWTEVILIALAGLVGAWSDKVGRRLVFALGFFVVGISYVLYPLATSYEELVGYRVIYALGMACVGVMFVAVQAEYPADDSRGKLVGFMGVISILGVILTLALLIPLPKRFIAQGASEIQAGQYAFWITSLIAFSGAVVLWLGLSKRKPVVEKKVGLLTQLSLCFSAARTNPRIALSYAAGFIGRADLVIVAVFMSLWITQAGRAQGMTTDEAQIQLSIMFGIVQISALIFAPIMGFIADRISRVATLAIACGLALVGYVWMGLLDVPMGPQAYPAAAVLGMGQVGAILAATALVGQETTEANTGAITGGFTLFGAIGILLSTKFGGWMFDAWMPGAPFIATGIVNGLIMLAAIGLIMAGVALPEQTDTESSETAGETT